MENNKTQNGFYKLCSELTSQNLMIKFSRWMTFGDIFRLSLGHLSRKFDNTVLRLPCVTLRTFGKKKCLEVLAKITR